MGLAQSPKIATDRLVLYYDQNNIKSYKGPAIQNLLLTIKTNAYISTGESYVAGTEYVDIPQLGNTLTYYNIIQNNYTSFTPNSASCCPNPFGYTAGYGTGFTVSPSTLYTYGIVYKVLSGYTHPNYMYRYEFTASGGSYITEGGVHNNSNRIHLGDGWYWAWGTFTTQSTTNWINYAGSWYYRYSDKTDRLSVAKVFMAAGDHTQLHPRYWPDVNTTRSSTDTILDYIGKNTVTATSLTYANTGQFNFNGSTSYLTTNAIPNKNEGTISAFFKMDSLRDFNTIFDNAYGANDWECWVYANGTITFRTNADSSDSRLDVAGLAANTWYNVTVTWTASQAKMYINGVLSNTDSTVGTRVQPTQLGIGGANAGNTKMAGQIPHFMMYDRALTDVEVLQNFNALRGRYGI